MGTIRLIAMDMDGTLLGEQQGIIPPANVEALRRASKMGIHLALASGRLPDDAGFYALDAGLPMHILGINGSVTVHQPLGEVAVARFIPEAGARAIRDILMELDLPFSISSVNEAALSAYPADPAAARLSQGTFLDRPGSRIRLWLDGTKIEPLMGRVNKFSVINPNTEKLALLRERIEVQVPEADVTSSWYDNLEIMAKGVNKGSALTELAAFLDIPMSEVMAIGDQDNDIPMIQAAGYGVAMGNASPAAAAAARFHTGTNTENGVAMAIKRLVPVAL